MTNYSINKFSKKFEKNFIEKDENDEEIEKGHKRSLKWFFRYLEAQGSDSKLLWQEIKSISLKTVCSIQPILKHYYSSLKSNDFWSGCCFEVLGLDIMISDNLKPYILEVNSSPSFGTDSKLDKDVKFNLINDTLRLVNLSFRRKLKILKEEKEQLQKRMLTGKRIKVNAQDRLLKKVLLIKDAETQMKKQYGNLGGYEKVFGVEEYLNMFEKKGVFRTKSTAAISSENSSMTDLQVKTVTSESTKIRKEPKRSLSNVTLKSNKKQNLRLAERLKSEKRRRKYLDDGDCLGINNSEKVFEFMKYAELFEKQVTSSKSKKSALSPEVVMNQSVNQVSANDLKPIVILKEQEKDKSKINSLSKLTYSLKKKKVLIKYKSCSIFKKEIKLVTHKELEAFGQLYRYHFKQKENNFEIKNICPMIRILFDLLKVLIDFNLKEEISKRIQILTDFRWKRICFCRLCSYLTQIEKEKEFIFIKLKKFLDFYEFPKSRAQSSRLDIYKKFSSFPETPNSISGFQDFCFNDHNSTFEMSPLSKIKRVLNNINLKNTNLPGIT